MKNQTRFHFLGKFLWVGGEIEVGKLDSLRGELPTPIAWMKPCISPLNGLHENHVHDMHICSIAMTALVRLKSEKVISTI